MNPQFWGPHAWIFLHTITLNYPKHPTDQDKQQYKHFFTSLQDILPCDKCAHHYSQHIRELPIDPVLRSRDELVRWLIKIHNEVNKDLDKPLYTYEQVIDEYKYKMSRLGMDETLVYKLIIVSLLLFIGYKYWKK